MKMKTEPEGRGVKSIQARKWRVKLPIFKTKIKFLISKYKNVGGLQLFEMKKTQI